MPNRPVKNSEAVSMITPMVYCETSIVLAVVCFEDGREVVARITPRVTSRTEP